MDDVSRLSLQLAADIVADAQRGTAGDVALDDVHLGSDLRPLQNGAHALGGSLAVATGENVHCHVSTLRERAQQIAANGARRASEKNRGATH